MTLGSTVPLAQIQNCQKRSSFEQAETATALHQNIAEKGSNAYYFAHNRHFEIPDDAKIISGPGLVTGGPPERLAKEDTDPKSIVTEAEKVSWIKEYSWADAGATVKIYIPCDGLCNITEDNVKASFEKRSVTLEIGTTPPRKLQLQKLNAEINTDECKVRVETAKGRVTVVLMKKKELLWRELLSNDK